MKQKIWLYVCLLLGLWWAVLFPEFTMTKGSYLVMDEYGNILEIKGEEAQDIYKDIMSAKPGEIKVRSAIWDKLTEMWSSENMEELMEEKKNAKVKVSGIQTIDDEKFEVVTNADAFYENIKDVHILVYDEETPDGVTNNRIELSPDCVRVIKKGAVEAEMEFVEGEEKEFSYKTSQGVIPFVALGKKIQYNLNACEFWAEFEYSLSVADFSQDCKMMIEATVLV